MEKIFLADDNKISRYVPAKLLKYMKTLKKSEKKLHNERDHLKWLMSMFEGHELKMVELKKEINALIKEAGQGQKYLYKEVFYGSCIYC